MKALLIALLLLTGGGAHAQPGFYFGSGGFMIDTSPPPEDSPRMSPAYIIPGRRAQPEAPALTSGEESAPEADEVSLPVYNAPALTAPRSSAQDIAIRAGIPTFVSTAYNPAVEMRGVSWGIAATSAIGGALLGVGVEIYDQVQMEDGINTLRVVQTGTLLGGSIFAGVVTGQAVQNALLVNSGLFGLSAGSTGSQLLSGFMGDALGSVTAAAIYFGGAYLLGWADPADVRAAMARGATGAVIMAAVKATGVQTLFSVTGTSGAAATLGPYAITYLAALGAVYLTDLLFESFDRAEASELLERSIFDGTKRALAP